jgi:hypothetical protein
MEAGADLYDSRPDILGWERLVDQGAPDVIGQQPRTGNSTGWIQLEERVDELVRKSSELIGVPRNARVLCELETRADRAAEITSVNHARLFLGAEAHLG